MCRRDRRSDAISLSLRTCGRIRTDWAGAPRRALCGAVPTPRRRETLWSTRHTREALEPPFERLYRFFPGLNFKVRVVLVRGWPWRTVAMIEWVDRACPVDGAPYVNEGTHVPRFSWGRLVSLHAYPDTQKVQDVCERRAREGIDEAAAPPILTWLGNRAMDPLCNPIRTAVSALEKRGDRRRPGLEGIEATRYIRGNEHPGVWIVNLSGHW